MQAARLAALAAAPVEWPEPLAGAITQAGLASEALAAALRKLPSEDRARTACLIASETLASAAALAVAVLAAAGLPTTP